MVDDWIVVEDVSKRYQPPRAAAVNALMPTSFKLSKGEFVAVVGPSGCGKTTLLKILAGLLAPTTGIVKIGGEQVTGPRGTVGVVFQAPLLLPWRNVLRNVLVPVEVLGLNRQKYTERARELLDLVGLTGFEKRYPNELSGGMQQRAAICRALAHDPPVLLMDEPFGALDAMTREHLNLELLRIWRETNKTIVFVTHSIAEAVFLADRVIVMTPRPGKIAEIINVEVPRPRTLDMMTSGQMGTIVSGVRKYFDGKGAIE